ncbi:uncharacterized protein GGS22DRAFT_192868 [Annulohypoxylon maeteangense]|uniref:uncharacterized protein n=1 Tax=Annulohypoxylon maeteangense TaxID=1927788 RepID=UPI002007F770|nr:uncharacterized protein GGS22DRAFT_192868 [Annulohypoxylon maeteangense]KAI0880733.1 hypothetical protein GGS22DRAFT_192868 [Annulohypoxylon maeteangense]
MSAPWYIMDSVGAYTIIDIEGVRRLQDVLTNIHAWGRGERMKVLAASLKAREVGFEHYAFSHMSNQTPKPALSHGTSADVNNADANNPADDAAGVNALFDNDR